MKVPMGHQGFSTNAKIFFGINKTPGTIGLVVNLQKCTDNWISIILINVWYKVSKCCFLLITLNSALFAQFQDFTFSIIHDVW